MPDFTKRSDGIEIMDDLNSSGEVIHQTLQELDTINKLLGGNSVTLQGVRKLLHGKSSAVHVADLGCGSGEMLRLLAQQFRKSNLQSTFIGFDANENIVQYAQQHVSGFPEISIAADNILSADFRTKKFDVIVATLFLHHFTSAQLIDIFKTFNHQARVGVVINDLHRHWLAYYAIKFLTALFSKSPMVKFDAPLSVLRGFTKNELVNILEQAGMEHYSLRWKWAFRWQVIIHS